MGRSVPVFCLVATLLAACGEHAPDTATMGAGPTPIDCQVRAEEALRLINAARAAGAHCGGVALPPAPALHWDGRLQQAASAHSADMAHTNYFEHRSPEGRTVRDRVAAAHYPMRGVGENIAGGDETVAEAVQGWLGSPAHCENLMDPHFTDVAVACVAQPGTQWGTYWTMVLGQRR